MKPHLRSNGKSGAGDRILIEALANADRYDGILGAVQKSIGEARQKAEKIKQEAEAIAASCLDKARAESAAIKAQANRDATDIKAEAQLSLREVHRAKTEVEELQSVLKYAQRQFEDGKKEFKLAIAGVFERHLVGG